MDQFDARFLIESERRRGEMVTAKRHRLVKEAQQTGMKILPLLSLKNINIGLLAVALAHSLDWLGDLFANWSCQLQSRYAPGPVKDSPESQPSPCRS